MKPKKVWVVLKVIDQGDRIIEVCDSEELANSICNQLESEYRTKKKEIFMKDFGETEEQADSFFYIPEYFVEEYTIRTN